MDEEGSALSGETALGVSRELSQRPRLYERKGTLFWQDPWVSRKALGIQLDPEECEGARRRETALAQIEEISKFLPKRPNHVIDVGCGPGYHLVGFAASGSEARGIDISPAAIEHARGERHAQRPDVAARIELVQGDMLSAPWGTADLVMLLFGEFCLLTPEERRVLLQKAATSLNAGGYLLLELFNQPVEDAVTEQTWEFAEAGEGFWSPEPYLELTATFVYTEARALVHRFAMLFPEGPVREERIWETSMDETRIAEEGAEAGLRLVRTVWDHPLFDGGGAEDGRGWFLALLVPEPS